MNPKKEGEDGESEYRLLRLTGYFVGGQFAKVDPDVYRWARRYRWRASMPKTPIRLVARNPKTGKKLNLPRLITGAGVREYPRFKDGDGLNCTRANLELVDNCDEAARPSPEYVPRKLPHPTDDQLARLAIEQMPPIMRWAAREDYRDARGRFW